MTKAGRGQIRTSGLIKGRAIARKHGMQAWNPARRALIVLVMLSHSMRRRMASAKGNDETCSYGKGCKPCLRTIASQTDFLSATYTVRGVGMGSAVGTSNIVAMRGQRCFQ